MTGRIGIIGVGHLARSLVAGFVRAGTPPAIVLSPRNAATSRLVAERFGATVAGSNAAVVEQSELVLLAARPADVIASAGGLPWRVDQTAVSLAAGIRLSALARAVAPAVAVRALATTAAEIGESPTCLYPDNAAARALFDRVGSVHAFPDESTYDAACVSGVVYSAFHVVLQHVAEWLEREAVPADEARLLAGSAVRAAAGMTMAHPERSLEQMVREFASPGTLTLAAVEALRTNGALRGLDDALDRALGLTRDIGRAAAD
jgi:pyrroline-5-carboxylate reductase